MNLEEFSDLAREHVKTTFRVDVEDVYCTILLQTNCSERRREVWNCGVDL